MQARPHPQRPPPPGAVLNVVHACMCARSIFLVFEYAEHDLGRLLDALQRPFTLPQVKGLLKQVGARHATPQAAAPQAARHRPQAAACTCTCMYVHVTPCTFMNPACAACLPAWHTPCMSRVNIDAQGLLAPACRAGRLAACLQLLSAVAHMHARWLVHRDLKMSNLLYTRTGLLKVCDFGLARCAGHPPMT